MAQYINKDAVLAEIERRKEKCDTFYDIALSNNVELAKVAIEEQKRQYDSLFSFIDTLEVEDVDIKREMQAFATLYLEPLKISDSNIGISITMAQLYRCAKHFFELGLRASNPLTWEDIRKIDTLCCKVEMEHIPKEEEHYQEVLKRFKKTKKID